MGNLSMRVGELDGVAVYEAVCADAGACKVRRRGGSQASGANDEDSGLFQPKLGYGRVLASQ